MDIQNLASAVRTSLEPRLIAEVSRLGTGLEDTTIRTAANKALDKFSTSFVNDVFKTGNGLLNDIPGQVVGQHNPANLTTTNLGSTGLYNNFNNIIKDQLSSSSLENLLNVFETELTQVVPSNSTLDFTSVKSALSFTLAGDVDKQINTTYKSYCDSTFSQAIKIPPVLKNVTGLFKSLVSDPVKLITQKLPVAQIESGFFDKTLVDNALEKLDIDFSTNITGRTLSDVRGFTTETTENEEKLVVTKKGFSDPSATYPTAEYRDEPETNKLARGEVNGTIVQKKNDDRIIGARLPYGDSFSEPLSPFNGEYPYNKVTQTESGHLIEIDDTPGNERLHVYHKSGTYIEIDSNGSVVKRAKGSSYEFIDRNGKIAILGQADVSINGACNIFVGNDANMEVIGNVNITCHNDITAMAGGKLNLSATDEINLHAANVNIEADRSLNILGDGDVYIMSGNTINVTANTTAHYTSVDASYFTAKKDLVISSVQATNIASGGDFTITANAKVSTYSVGVFVTSTEEIHMLSSGDFNADGQNIYLNSGKATEATPYTGNVTYATNASTSKIGLLDGRKFIDEVELSDPEPIRYDARYTELGEGFTPTTDELVEQRDVLVTSGIATKEELEETQAVVIAESSASSSQNTVLMPEERLLQLTELPGNYKLSPNFTLDNMWRTVAVSPGKHPIQAQNGLTYGQIVYNLQALALNVLEPVRALYPKMIITSCFRHASSNAKSAHPYGLAVDLQFPGASREEYYNIAVKLAQVLSYDQILLEYWVQANNPWIHIGISPQGKFNPSSQRKVAWTFKDHALYKQALVNLA